MCVHKAAEVAPHNTTPEPHGKVIPLPGRGGVGEVVFALLRRFLWLLLKDRHQIDLCVYYTRYSSYYYISMGEEEEASHCYLPFRKGEEAVSSALVP